MLVSRSSFVPPTPPVRASAAVLGVLSCLFSCLAVARAAGATTPTPTPDAELTAALAGTTRLRDLVRLAIARNPDVRERRARTAAATARTSVATRLPDPQLRYEQRGLPLARPWGLGSAEAVMVGISQTLPAPGTRAARARAAAAEATQSDLEERMRRRDLTAEVRRAFAAYYRADRQLALHRSHAEITARLVELARASYRAGRRGQQDVVRLGLELARVHGDLAHLVPELRATQALINSLLDRAPDAPLGPPEDIAPPAATTPVAAPGSDLVDPRPELASAQQTVARAEAALDEARRTARWPSLSLGVDYMYMPQQMHRHGYTAMAAINLPWLTGSRRDEARAAEEILRAEQHALVSVRNAVRYDLAEATARLQAAQGQFEVIDRDIVGQSRRNLEAAESAYAAGNADALTLLDALRTHLDVAVDRVRALAHVETAAADLARARGEETLP